MTQKLGRRKLNKRIDDLAQECQRLRNLNHDAYEQIKEATRKASAAEREALAARKEVETRKSAFEAAGYFQVHILDESYVRRFDRWSLSVRISPEAYRLSFDYGGGERFRDMSSYCHLVSMDIAYRVKQTLIEHMSKEMNGACR